MILSFVILLMYTAYDLQYVTEIVGPTQSF